MSSLYYLLSSPEGFPLSKCCFNNKLRDPNWKSIARLIAFIANIFPKHEATQFSDGNRTFFCQPQETATGECFFVTLFTDDGNSMDFSSLGRYIGYVISRLFQSSLEECFSFLKGRMSDLIQKSTYQETLQEDSVSDTENSYNEKDLLLGGFSILESLNAFEEHFIVELLLIGQSFCQHWFSPVLHYCSKGVIASERNSVKICAVFNISADGLLSKLFSNFNLENHSGYSYEDLEKALLDYNNSITPTPHLETTDQDQESIINGEFGLSLTADKSHLLRIPAAKCDSDICAEKGFYLAVSKLFQKDHSLLFVCHIPSAVISIECPHHKNLEKKYNCDKDKYKNGDHKLFMYPLSIFKREFCVAWNDCLQHLERALFVSYKNGDIQSPSFYHHIVVPLGKSDNEIEYRGIPCPALDSYEELKCIGLTSEIVSEGNHDDVEYIPHPPEIRNQSTAQSSINVENDALLCSGIQGLNVGTKIPQKSILRPGRLYV